MPSAVATAAAIVTEALDYFRGRAPGGEWQGINECVNPPIGYHGVDAYVASGTNVLQALADLLLPLLPTPMAADAVRTGAGERVSE